MTGERETPRTTAGHGTLASLAPPFAIFLATRILLALVARFASHLLQPLARNPSVLPRTDPLAHIWAWASPWFRFDAWWYVDVAEHGYHAGALGHANTNFFPLYPLLIRLLQPLTGGSPWIAALIVANAACLAAMAALWHWASPRWPHDISLAGVLLVATFPFAFFLAAPYSEPLFLALAASTFLLAERRQWWAAIAAAGLCTVTRPVGLAVVAALLVLALQQRGRLMALRSLLALIPFALFALYLWASVGDPLAFTVYHSAGWIRPHGGLGTTIVEQFQTQLSPFDRVDAAAALLYLLSAILVWRRLGAAYALYVVLGVLLPLAHGLVSLERYVIVLFPVPIAWATLDGPPARIALFALSLLGLILATAMFATGYSIF